MLLWQKILIWFPAPILWFITIPGNLTLSELHKQVHGDYAYMEAKNHIHKITFKIKHKKASRKSKPEKEYPAIAKIHLLQMDVLRQKTLMFLSLES